MARGSGVFVSGLDQTRRQMRQLAPDLLKEMNREVRTTVLGPIVADAKQLVPAQPPLSGWNKKAARPGSRPSYSPYGRRWDGDRLAWDMRAVKRGIRVGVGRARKRGDSFKGAYSIVNGSAVGAVFELMGRGKSDVPMVGNVRQVHGAASRLIWRAWDRSQGSATVPLAVADTIRAFEVKFQQRLDARGIR